MADKSKIKKIILWAVAVIIILSILAVGVSGFVFVSINPEFKAEKLSDTDYFTGARLTQNVLYRVLRSKDKDENDVRVLKISNREMQSLMRIAENADALLYIITGRKSKNSEGKNNIYKLHYDRGIFSFKVRLTDVWLNMCFVGHGQAKLKFENGKLDIDFISLKVGKFELSQKRKEQVKQYIYNWLKNEPAYDIVRSAVLKVDFVEYGNVRVYYMPYRLRNHVKNAVMQ